MLRETELQCHYWVLLFINMDIPYLRIPQNAFQYHGDRRQLVISNGSIGIVLVNVRVDWIVQSNYSEQLIEYFNCYLPNV